MLILALLLGSHAFAANTPASLPSYKCSTFATDWTRPDRLMPGGKDFDLQMRADPKYPDVSMADAKIRFPGVALGKVDLMQETMNGESHLVMILSLKSKSGRSYRSVAYVEVAHPQVQIDIGHISNVVSCKLGQP